MGTSMETIEGLLKELDPEFAPDPFLTTPHPYTLSVIKGMFTCTRSLARARASSLIRSFKSLSLALSLAHSLSFFSLSHSLILSFSFRFGVSGFGLRFRVQGLRCRSRV